MENNKETTGMNNATVASFAQGTATPFTMVAASGAAHRMREYQRALKETVNSSAKTVKEREAEKRRKKEMEWKAEKEATKAALEARKKEEWAKKYGKPVEELTMDELLGMEESEEEEMELLDEGGKRNVDREGLAEVARILETRIWTHQ